MSFKDVVLKEFREKVELAELYTSDYILNLYIKDVDKIINKVYDKILSNLGELYLETIKKSEGYS